MSQKKHNNGISNKKKELFAALQENQQSLPAYTQNYTQSRAEREENTKNKLNKKIIALTLQLEKQNHTNNKLYSELKERDKELVYINQDLRLTKNKKKY